MLKKQTEKVIFSAYLADTWVMLYRPKNAHACFVRARHLGMGRLLWGALGLAIILVFTLNSAMAEDPAPDCASRWVRMGNWGRERASALAQAPASAGRAVAGAARATAHAVTHPRESTVRAYQAIRAQQVRYWGEVWEPAGIFSIDSDLRMRGVRLVIRPRDTTQGRSFWNALSGNPIAEIFNRPREVTIPAQMTAAILALYYFDIPIDVFSALGWWADREVASQQRAESEFLERESERIFQTRSVPGAGFVQNLARAGFIDTPSATRLLLEHERTLDRWFSGQSPTLPRVEEMVRLGMLNREQAEFLYGEIRQAHTQATQAIVTISPFLRRLLNLEDNASIDAFFARDLAHGLQVLRRQTPPAPPAQIRALEERVRLAERQAGELLRYLANLKRLPPAARAEQIAALAAGRGISAEAIPEIQRALVALLGAEGAEPTLHAPLIVANMLEPRLRQPGTPLASLAASVRSHLSSALFPLPMRNGRSELALSQILLNEQNPPPGVAATRRIILDRLVPLGEGLIMTDELLRNPGAITARQEALRNLLPPRILAASARPTIPSFNRPIEFDGQTLRTENDRWRVIMNDPRLQEARELVERDDPNMRLPGGRNIPTDLYALQMAENMMRGTEELRRLDRLLQTRDADGSVSRRAASSEEIAFLFGLVPRGEGVPRNMVLAPYLDPALQRLAARPAAANSAESNEQTTACLRGIVDIVRDFVVTDSEWTRANPTGNYASRLESLAEVRMGRLTAALDFCGPAPAARAPRAPSAAPANQ